MPLKLTIDAMPILAAVGGISNYVNPLVHHFLKISPSTFQTTLHFRTGSKNRRKSFRALLQDDSVVRQNAFIKKTNFPDRILKLLWQSRIPFLGKVTLPKTDIYLATTEMIPLHRGTKRVAIIHDLTPAVIPQFFPEPRERYLKRMRSLIENCHKIIAVSQTTANNILKFCDIRNERIAIIYAGLPSMPTVLSSHHSILEKLGVERPYVLYVGALAPNKNLEGTIRCFARFLRRTGLDWQLVLAGRSFMPEGYYETMARGEGIANRVIFTGWLDEERWALYRNAELLIHLSWYEGFPLSVLEAMAFGLPVLASNRGPFPEAIQNGEQIVDPENENAVSEKLAQFAEDPAVRSRWKEYMIKRANDFSWEKSSRKLLEVLQAVNEVKQATN